MNSAMLSLPRPGFNKIPAAPVSLSSSQLHHVHSLVLPPIRSSSDAGNGETINTDGGTSAPIPPPITPPDAVEIRFKRGSKKRRKQLRDDDDGQFKMKTAAPKKEWESMTLTEKAVEVYMGEKGLLFWLNKFAYASIFIIIGGWIVFRFVGPALNLYQLDAPPLEPTSVFKGS
ncbi:OLC1v1011027C1 [Oldenlandia corymbosa var. corymbosa]|uniref:OLC1v1011027C1 n=1 Tax=Oldenlandia corymbosa var. corymbosa TaxID=529605 RepID=A0AAV1DSX0_OLDCO|nr:OLC1v1011027C1 [Oldenlandia corymbosa var. corymbosa]